MLIQRLTRIQRLCSPVILLCLTVLVVDLPALAQMRSGGTVRITNVDWVVDGRDVLVTYDLIGDLEEEVVVRLTLLRRDDRMFRFEPQSITGDIGQGRFTGLDRMIRWHKDDDVNFSLGGNDYYFEVAIDRPREIPWFMVVITAAVGGATVYSLLSNSEGPPPSALR